MLDARINFVLSEIEAPLWLSTRHSYVLPKERRRSEAKAVAIEDFRDAEAKFATLLGEGEYFAGDEFTIADIIAGHCIGWATNAEFEPRAELTSYFERLRARPAWTRARKE